MENNQITNPVDYVTPNSIAAIWSMMLPGLGQLMKRQVIAGIFWAFFVAAGYFAYLWPGLILHTICILDAAFNKGSGSNKMSLVSIVAFLLAYIVIRNDFL